LVAESAGSAEFVFRT